MATDHAKQAFIGMGIGIVLNILVAVALIPIIGLAGAAVASLMNVICSVIISHRYLKKIIPVIIEKRSITHIVAATSVMAISLLIIGQIPASRNVIHTALMVLIGAAIYFIILLKLNKNLREDVLRSLKIQWIM